MKKTIIWICSVIGMGAVMALVFGAMENNAPVRTINVVGECDTVAPKDKTAITLRVTTLGENATDSMKQATQLASKITGALQDMPVEMQTTQFSSYEKTEWDNDARKSVTLGIETSIAIEISANNIEIIENVLNQFAGVPNIYPENLRMYTSPAAMQPIVEQCMGVAVENARIRAQVLAGGDGKSVGKMISVSYGNMENSNPYDGGLMRPKMLMATSAAMDTSGTLVATDTQVHVSVNAIFEIK